MAIKGLSDVLRIPRAGHVRIGRRRPRKGDTVEWTPPGVDEPIQAQVQAGARGKGGEVTIKLPDGDTRKVPEAELKVMGLGGIPEKLDHMVFDPHNRELLPLLTELFGDKPTSIPITLALDDEWPWDRVFPQYMMMWKHGPGLVCKGDGEHIHYRVTAKGKKLTLEEGRECNPETCEYALPDSKGFVRCRRVASLQFLIRHPKLNVMAVWQVDTGSIHSIININSRLRFFKDLDSFGHSIQGIPLVLTVTPREVHPDQKKRVVYVLDLELDPHADMGGLQITRDFSAARMLEAPSQAKLPADGEALRNAQEVQVDEPELAEVPGELFPPGEGVTLGMEYAELPEEVRQGCEILGWIPGQAMAELQAFSTPDGELDVDGAKKHLAILVDAKIAEAEEGDEGSEGEGSPEGEAEPGGTVDPLAL